MADEVAAQAGEPGPAAAGVRAARGRPRDPGVDAAIRAATVELLGEAGYARLTMDQVAARARVSKSSLYLRWPNKVALAGFGLDSLIEIGASTVVIWELSGTGQRRQQQTLRLIGYGFAALAVYLLAQSTVVLATGYHPRHSALGITWTAVTAVTAAVMRPGGQRSRTAVTHPA